MLFPPLDLRIAFPTSGEDTAISLFGKGVRRAAEKDMAKEVLDGGTHSIPTSVFNK